MGNAQIKLKQHDFPFHIEKSGNPTRHAYPPDKSWTILSLRTVRPMGKEHQNESDPNPVFKVDLQGRVRPDTGNVGSDIYQVGHWSGRRTYPTDCQPCSEGCF